MMYNRVLTAYRNNRKLQSVYTWENINVTGLIFTCTGTLAKARQSPEPFSMEQADEGLQRAGGAEVLEGLSVRSHAVESLRCHRKRTDSKDGDF